MAVSDVSDEVEGLEVARITIVRRLLDDGNDTFEVTAETSSVLESLGLLELAKMDLIAPGILDMADDDDA